MTARDIEFLESMRGILRRWPPKPKQAVWLRDLVERSPGLAGLRLYVDQRNEQGQSVYEALGMTRERYHLYEWLKTDA